MNVEHRQSSPSPSSSWSSLAAIAVRHHGPPRATSAARRGRAVARDPRSATAARRPATRRGAAPHRPGRRGGPPAAARTGTGRASRPTPASPVPCVPPDPETRRRHAGGSSSTAASVALMSVGLGGFGAAVRRASSGRKLKGGFGAKITVGKLDDIKAGIAQANGLLLRARGPRVAHRVPGRRPARRPRRSTPAPMLAGMEAGIDALYQKCPHLGCRVPYVRHVASGSSARATARSTTGSVRRRAARRRAAWTASPSPISGGNVTIDTGTHRPPARPSAPTPPARRPRARTASPAAE